MKELATIIADHRDLLKCDWWTRFGEFSTDQGLGLPRPDVFKPPSPDQARIDLVPLDALTIGDVSLKTVIQERRSRRYYSNDAISLEELSFLLWTTQGITQVIEDGSISYYKRTVPSGGNRHPFETYLSIHNIAGLEEGLYRYLPLDHQLVVERLEHGIAKKVQLASLDQYSMVGGKRFNFVECSAVTYIWTALPYRTEWRYGPAAAKLVAVDAGHVGQNLYLACGAIGAGTVAMGAFDRVAMDQVLGVDGEEEFTIYLGSVGKLP